MQQQLLTYRTIFDEVPVACAILDAEDLRIEQANEQMLEIWDKSATVIGQKLLDVFPELSNQHYPALIRKSINDNVVHKEKGGRFTLIKQGTERTLFMDYCYRPIVGQNNKVTALLITATDVTEREEDKLFRTESIRTLKALVTSAPVAMCLFMGSENAVNTVNSHMLTLWKTNEYLGVKELRYVFHTGLPYSHVVDGVAYSYTPVRDALGKTTGIMLVAGVMSSPANLPE
ncbi:MAG: PAS domain-containing protein [Pedobacter sp.]|nr:MAG: PAS domain-containing protein [Pedobacter sp.]